MRVEIINPSDQCFLEHSDTKALIAAGLILGEGKYGLVDVESMKTILPLLLFVSPKPFLTETFGGEDAYASYVAANYGPISEALLSIHYPNERSSLNDIGARAKRIGKKLRERMLSGKVSKDG